MRRQDRVIGLPNQDEMVALFFNDHYTALLLQRRCVSMPKG